MPRISPEFIPLIQERIEALRGIPQCSCGSEPSWQQWKINAGSAFVMPTAQEVDDADAVVAVAWLTCQHCGQMTAFDLAIVWPDKSDTS